MSGTVVKELAQKQENEAIPKRRSQYGERFKNHAVN